MSRRELRKHVGATAVSRPFAGAQAAPAPIPSAREMMRRLDVREIAVTQLPVNLIDPDPGQPRVIFTEEDLENLAADIRERGLLQPIAVKKAGERYQIVFGERRLRAHRKLGLDLIDCRVLAGYTELELRSIQLSENLQRKDLTDFEEAVAVGDVVVTAVAAVRPELVEYREGDFLTARRRLISLLHKMKHETSGRKQREPLDPEDARLIEEAFARHGQVTWKTYLSRSARIFSLPDDLLEACQAGLTSAQAFIIGRLTGESLKTDEEQARLKRAGLVARAKELTNAALRQEVEAILGAAGLPQNGHSSNGAGPGLFARARGSLVVLSKARLGGTEKEEVERLLARLEEIAATVRVDEAA